MQTDHEERLSIGASAKFLKVSIDTLRRWEKKGKVQSFRSPGGHRYFLKEDLENLFGKKHLRTKNITPPEKEVQENSEVAFNNLQDISEDRSDPFPPIVYQEVNISSSKNEDSNPSSINISNAPVRSTNKPFARIFLIALSFFFALDLILVSFYFIIGR